RELYRTEGAPRAVVPFELANSRPIINVRLNGSKTPLRFVIDTGSGMCVLSAASAERLNIKPVAQGGMARAVGGGGRFEIVYGFLSSLSIGEARVENVPIYIRQFHNQQEPVDGYIGLSVLAKYLASVDYGQGLLTLLRDSERPAAPVTTVTPDQAAATASLQAQPASNASTPNTNAPPPTTVTVQPAASRSYELPIRSTSSGFWSSAVVLDGVQKPLNFIVDTGASISVVSQQLAQTEDMSRFEQKSRIKIFGAAGVSEDVTTLLLPHVTIGTYKHPNLSAAVLDMSAINETSGFEQTGIIGGNILRFFRVTFDFQRGVVQLDPISNRVTPAAPSSREPETITPTSGATP
ncbi:MAG TPA: aspartyl protease family protein, partial [Pyrinomonadaceae bacterium]|nr:aspartyl protease family protein [Pyrinomonadaceae bacterium]